MLDRCALRAPLAPCVCRFEPGVSSVYAVIISRSTRTHGSGVYRPQSRDAYFCPGFEAERCTISFVLLTPLWLKLGERSILPPCRASFLNSPVPSELSELCAHYARRMRGCRRGGVLGARPLRGTEYDASPAIDRKSHSPQQHTPAQGRRKHASNPRAQSGCNMPRGHAGAPQPHHSHSRLPNRRRSASIVGASGALGSRGCQT